MCRNDNPDPGFKHYHDAFKTFLFNMFKKRNGRRDMVVMKKGVSNREFGRRASYRRYLWQWYSTYSCGLAKPAVLVDTRAVVNRGEWSPLHALGLLVAVVYYGRASLTQQETPTLVFSSRKEGVKGG